MTKVTIDRALIEQALEAIELNWKTDEGDAVKPLLRAALAEPAVEPVGYVRMLSGEPTPDDDGCVFSYGENPYRDTYGDEEWVPVSVASPPPPTPVNASLLSERKVAEIIKRWDGTLKDLIADTEAAVRQKVGLK